MKYFIGYLIPEPASTWHINLAKDIADKFNIWKIYERVPPHVTIYYLSELENIETVKYFIKAWIKDKKISGNFTIKDFGHFEDRVVFAKTESDDPIRSMIEELIKNIKLIPNMIKEDYPVWHPHATLAHKISPEEVKAIWEYVSNLEKPNFILPFDNITIFRFEDEKWVIEESIQIV